MLFALEHAFHCYIRIDDKMSLANMFVQVRVLELDIRIDLLGPTPRILEARNVRGLGNRLLEMLLPLNSQLHHGDVICEVRFPMIREVAGVRKCCDAKIQYCCECLEDGDCESSVRVHVEEVSAQEPWLREAMHRIPGLVSCGTCMLGCVHPGGGQEDLFQHFCFRDVGEYLPDKMSALDPDEWAETAHALVPAFHRCPRFVPAI